MVSRQAPAEVRRQASRPLEAAERQVELERFRRREAVDWICSGHPVLWALPERLSVRLDRRERAAAVSPQV